VNSGPPQEAPTAQPSEPPRRRSSRRKQLAISGIVGAIIVVVIVLVVVLLLGKSFDVTAVNVSYTGSGAAGVCTLGSNFTRACEPNSYNVCLEGLGPCPNNLAGGKSAQATFNTELQNNSECGNVYEISQVTTPSSVFRITSVTNLGLGLPFLLGHTPVTNDPVFCTTALQIIVDYTVSNSPPASAALDLVVTVVLS
jgi:hypothetical protein